MFPYLNEATVFHVYCAEFCVTVIHCVNGSIWNKQQIIIYSWLGFWRCQYLDMLRLAVWNHESRNKPSHSQSNCTAGHICNCKVAKSVCWCCSCCETHTVVASPTTGVLYTPVWELLQVPACSYAGTHIQLPGTSLWRKYEHGWKTICTENYRGLLTQLKLMFKNKL